MLRVGRVGLWGPEGPYCRFGRGDLGGRVVIGESGVVWVAVAIIIWVSVALVLDNDVPA
jgi:hypothetical protein